MRLTDGRWLDDRRDQAIVEGAVFDDQLRSRFEWLRDPDESVVATPPVLIAFDVLYVKGRDVSQRFFSGRGLATRVSLLQRLPRGPLCVACHGVRSHPVPVALVGECFMPVV